MVQAASQRQLTILIAVGVALAFAMPSIFFGIDYMGANIQSQLRHDLVADYIKACLGALVIFTAIAVLPFPGEDKKNLLWVWLAKVAVVLVMMLFYERNYPLDAYWYFQQSQQKRPYYFDEIGFGNGTANILAFTWGLENFFVRTASYHTQKLVCAFFGMMGIYFFYRGLKGTYPRLSRRFFIYLSMVPTILFWSSILGKDPFIVFGIGLAFYGMMGIKKSLNPLYLVPFVIGVAVVGLMRVWMMPILIFPFFIGWIAKVRNNFFRGVIAIGFLAGIYFNIRYVMESNNFANTDQVAKGVGAIATSWQSGGSAGDVPVITNMGQALRFLPYGMFTALFRPLPGEVMNPFGLLAGLENLAILYMLWKAIRAWKVRNFLDHSIIWYGAFIVIWASIYAFISPQNLGSAVRFRLQVMPVMIFLFYYVGFYLPAEAAASGETKGRIPRA